MSFRNGRGRRNLYRSRDGKVFGVCKGLAEYFEVKVKWVRVIAIGAMLFTGFWPTVAVYLVAAYLMKPEPVVPINDEMEEEFYSSYTTSRVMALQRLKRKFDNLDRRIQRMESFVTTPEFSWQQRFER